MLSRTGISGWSVFASIVLPIFFLGCGIDPPQQEIERPLPQQIEDWMPEPPKEPVVLTRPEDIKRGMTKVQVERFFQGSGTISGGDLSMCVHYDGFFVMYNAMTDPWRVISVSIADK